MYLCLCRTVRESDVEVLGRNGVTSPKELVKALGLDQKECCGRCLRMIQAFVATARRAAELSDEKGGTRAG